MATPRSRGATSRIRLTVMFLVVMLPPAVTLIWLGLQLLEQDRFLEARAEIENREAAAEAIARSLGQSLNEAGSWSPPGPLAEGALGVLVKSSVVQSYPAGKLLWVEASQALPEAPSQPFEDAEKAEFFQGAPRAALSRYQELARSTDASIRAGALLRVARIERRQQRIDPALNAYKSLAASHGIASDGTPMDLLARRNICDLLEQSSRREELLTQAQGLEKDFLNGSWILDGATWELAEKEIERWTGRPLEISEDRRAFSVGTNWIWKTAREGMLPASGRRGLLMDGIPVTLAWHTRGSEIEAVVIGPTLLRAWIDNAAQNARGGARPSLLTESGELLAGGTPDSSVRVVSRTPSETGLPWTLALGASDTTSATTDFVGRRRLLGWGLAAIVLLLAGGSYVLWRLMAREIAVARLQADFVAAVSHEFRTPLTSLRHVTELLEEDDGLPPSPEQEKRKTFYAALSRNTERLHRLVESLLDFSRMETGKKPWKLEPMDAAVLAAGVTSEFQKEVESRGVHIDLDVDQSGALRLRADAAALGHALWNLLDNAVKYSPESREVHVSVARHPRGIAISVRDEGLGVPTGERRDIFRKFVRGRKASELGIKGTGLGLALVSHIVEAHGGAMELDSEEGEGSTFRMIFPALA